MRVKYLQECKAHRIRSSGLAAEFFVEATPFQIEEFSKKHYCYLINPCQEYQSLLFEHAVHERVIAKVEEYFQSLPSFLHPSQSDPRSQVRFLFAVKLCTAD